MLPSNFILSNKNERSGCAINMEVLAVVNPFSPSAWFKTVPKYKTNEIKTTNNRIHKQGRRDFNRL